MNEESSSAEEYASAIFYAIVERNPILQKDARIKCEIMLSLLNGIDAAIRHDDVVDYDVAVTRVASIVNLPKELVEPFLSILIPASVIDTNGKKLSRHCKICNFKHEVSLKTSCISADAIIVKTNGGIILINGTPATDKRDLN